MKDRLSSISNTSRKELKELERSIVQKDNEHEKIKMELQSKILDLTNKNELKDKKIQKLEENKTKGAGLLSSSQAQGTIRKEREKRVLDISIEGERDQFKKKFKSREKNINDLKEVIFKQKRNIMGQKKSSDVQCERIKVLTKEIKSKDTRKNRTISQLSENIKVLKEEKKIWIMIIGFWLILIRINMKRQRS